MTKKTPAITFKISWPIVAMCVLFVISRLWILYAPIRQSTVGLFTQTGYEYRYAAAHGESVYAVHERKARAELESANPGGPPPDPSRLRLEYPPLAIWAMTLPTYFAPPVGPEWELTDDHFRASKTAFRWMMAAIDASSFAVLYLLLRRLYPNSNAQAWRLAIYLVGGLLLYHILYDRFDLLMGWLVLIAVALLISRTHWSIPLAALAVAIHIKLVPVLLVPVFVMGRRFVDMAIRSSVLIGWCVLMLLPFLMSQGRDAIGFLGYHAERGVQVESIPATILLLLGNVTQLKLSHGAIDVVSQLATTVATISTLLGVLVVLALGVAIVLWAKPDPRQIIVLTTLMLWAALATAKVFSPQYLLWLLPLIPLLPIGRRTGPLFHIAFLLLCALTTYIFPYRYWTDIARITDSGILPPTPFGVALLTLRNGLFVAMAISLAVLAWQNRRDPTSIEPHQSAG